MCKTTRDNTIMVAAFFGLAAILTVFGLYYYGTKVESGKPGAERGFSERCAVPAPMIETEAPLPLQIDTNAPAKVTVRTKITL